MDFSKLLDSLSDKEFLEKRGSRRSSFEQFKKLGKDAAIASIPFGLAATSESTKAATAKMASSNMSSAAFQTNATTILQFALKLEYLEAEFYSKGVQSGVIPAPDQDIFNLIASHETSHVTFLQSALGDDSIPQPNFDFTAGGLFDPFNQSGTGQQTAYAQFLALSQGFEDTGVRAYKGQAGALANDNALLQYALQIHSVEARHAAQVRYMRRNQYDAPEKAWITRSQSSLPQPAQPVYDGEQNTVQGGVDLAGLFSDFGGVDAITESFDEPLSKSEVTAIAELFIVD